MSSFIVGTRYGIYFCMRSCGRVEEEDKDEVMGRYGVYSEYLEASGDG